MPRYLFLLFFLLWSLVEQVSAQRLSYVQGDLIVQLSPGKDIRNFIKSHERFDGYPTQLQIGELLSKPLNIWLLRFDESTVPYRRFIYQIQKDFRTQAVQLNHFVELRSTIPDDAFFDRQWYHLNDGQEGTQPGIDMDLDLAWDVTTGGLTPDGDTIVVCIIDNGQDLSHQDFADNLWVNNHEIPNNGIDDDNNGFVDDYRGWHTGFDNDNIDDANWHGTPVSGIVGAKGNNGLGVAGINWDVKLMIVTAGFFGQSFDEAQLIKAYNYGLIQRDLYNRTNGERGAFVVATNSSFGIARRNPVDFPVWCNLFDELGAAGILGPSATADISIDVELEGDIPTACSSDFVIGVTNVGLDGELSDRAGFGAQSIDLGAFGESIWTTDDDNSYDFFSGTSASTPMVSGAIALLYSAPCESLIGLAKADPAAAALLVKQYILEGVVPNATLAGKTVSGGYLNINNSMNLLLANCADCIPSTSVELSELDDQSATVSWNTNPTILKTDFRWKAADETEWNLIENATSPLLIGDLTPCTEYEFQLKDSCESIALGYTESTNFQTLGCCSAPSSITLGIVDTDLALINWPEEFGALAYEFSYRKFGEADWTSRVTLNNNIGLPRLDTCTTYQIQIAIACERIEVFTDTSEIFMFSTLGCGSCLEAEYCVPARINASEEWIAMVKVNDFENRSASDNGYGDFTGLDLELERGREHTFQIEPGFLNGINRANYLQIWIDLDQNGSFTSSELLFEPDNPTSDVTIASVNIPDGIKLGKTRMRISMLLQSGIGPCTFSSNQVGEFEDYCISIVEKQTTSIEPNSSQINRFEVYPNPTFPDELSINSQFQQIIKDYSLDLLDSQGKMVFQKTFNNHPANILQTKKLDISQLQQGVYWLRFRAEGFQTLVSKVIVIK